MLLLKARLQFRHIRRANELLSHVELLEDTAQAMR
jgi:hypothetical protein